MISKSNEHYNLILEATQEIVDRQGEINTRNRAIELEPGGRHDTKIKQIATHEKKIKILENKVGVFEKELEQFQDKLLTNRNELTGLREALATKRSNIGVKTGTGLKSGGAVPNYRSVNLYVNFSQYVYNVAKNINKINKIFKNGLIHHLGYIEPKTLQDYLTSYQEFEKMFMSFVKLAYTNGQFKINLSSGSIIGLQNETETEELNRRVVLLMEELEKLNKNDQYIRQNYNFKNKSINNKKKSAYAPTVKPILYEDEDQ